MVRAGEKATFVDNFIDNNLVAIGWRQAGDIDGKEDKAAVEHHLRQAYSGESPGTIANWASQIK